MLLQIKTYIKLTLFILNTSVLGGDQQFGFIYLQPALRHQFTLTNRGVETALQVDMNFKLNYHNTLWPRSPDNTNFRMAKVDYSVPDTHNDRHSEKQLLQDDGLRRMRRGCCPKFVLIYSTLLPCMNRPPKNPPPPNPPEDRCLEIIGKAKTEFQNDCPDTYFFLYTHQNGPRNACKIHQDFFRWEQEYLTNNHINWLHPWRALRL